MGIWGAHPAQRSGRGVRVRPHRDPLASEGRLEGRSWEKLPIRSFSIFPVGLRRQLIKLRKEIKLDEHFPTYAIKIFKKERERNLHFNML